MNILLSMPEDGQSNAYIINALQDMGHKVIHIDHRRYFKHCTDIIPRALKQENIELFLVLHLAPHQTYGSDFIRQLKVSFPHVKYASWIFDATLDGKLIPDNEQLLEIIKEYDYFFTVCDGQVEELQEKGVNAHWVQEGASGYAYDLTKGIEKKIDVSFIGQVGHPKVHTDRVPLIKKIINKFDNTLVVGPVYTQETDILSHHLLRPTYNDVEHARIVAQSKINLAHSGWGDINHYFSARAYRLMANGGFVLANHSKGIEDIFEVGKEIATYTDHKDCLEKIKYYLKHEDEREEIAKAGRARVLKDYLFNNSLKTILGIIK